MVQWERCQKGSIVELGQLRGIHWYEMDHNIDSARRTIYLHRLNNGFHFSVTEHDRPPPPEEAIFEYND